MPCKHITWETLSWEQKQAVITYSIALECEIHDAKLIEDIREITHEFLVNGKDIQLALYLKSLVNKVGFQIRQKRKSLDASDIDKIAKVGFYDIILSTYS